MNCDLCPDQPCRSPGSFCLSFARGFAGWVRWRNARQMEAVPYDIRKDIGWRTSD